MGGSIELIGGPKMEELKVGVSVRVYSVWCTHGVVFRSRRPLLDFHNTLTPLPFLYF